MSNSTIPAGEGVAVACSVLSSDERRAIVRELSVSGAPLPLPELADRIAGGRDVRTLRVRLYHQHLPQMRRAGLADYHRDTDLVALTPSGRRVGDAVERMAELLDDDLPG